jgi:hypothetical protein
VSCDTLPPSEPCVRLSPYTAPRSIFLWDLLTGRFPSSAPMTPNRRPYLTPASPGFHLSVRWSPCPTSAPFRGGYLSWYDVVATASPASPIGPVMSSRRLSTGRIRFFGHRFLLGSCAFLAVGPLSYRDLPCLRRTDPMRVYTFRTPQDTCGVGVSFTPGPRCPRGGRSVPVAYWPRLPYQPSSALTFTKPMEIHLRSPVHTFPCPVWGMVPAP